MLAFRLLQNSTELLIMIINQLENKFYAEVDNQTPQLIAVKLLKH